VGAGVDTEIIVETFQLAVVGLKKGLAQGKTGEKPAQGPGFAEIPFFQDFGIHCSAQHDGDGIDLQFKTHSLLPPCK
jgi:hypothetical protein